jgi:endonuclease/exonuclease/phosphatase family metal-dependent hydrolase
MRMNKVAATAAVLSVVATVTATVLSGAPATAVATGYDVRVGTYNIKSVSDDPKATGDKLIWKERRGPMIAQIMGEKLDVLGVQEANQSSIYGTSLVEGRNQYLDLLNGLRTAGGNWKITNDNPYNCYKAWSSQNCKYTYRAASQDNRILYNADTVAMVSNGSYLYPHQVAGKNARYLAWAKFRVLATGDRFLFTTTHLDPYSDTVRAQQWRDMIGKVNAVKGALPVIATGDFNTSKWDSWAASLLPAMVNNGYGDAVGQRYNTNGIRPRPARYTNIWLNSFNKFRRPVGGYPADRFNTTNPRTGNSIDWIFASNGLAVPDYEVVANYDPQTLELTGVIPSDHHMVRATITLP